MITNLLLLGILFAEAFRIYQTNVKESKKKHFTRKANGVEKMIWDLEFKAFKSRELREDTRKRYESMKSRVYSKQTEIENFKGKDEDKARLIDEKTRAENEVKKLEIELNAIDAQLNGSKPTNENPDGVLGINEEIDSYAGLLAMLRDWRKTL